MTNVEMAAVLRKLAAILDPSGQSMLPAAQAATVPQVRPGNMFSNAVPAGPWDPAWPGYQSGDGWQVMLRRYAADAGLVDRNAYVRDRGLIPRWPDSKQDWEQ